MYVNTTKKPSRLNNRRGVDRRETNDSSHEAVRQARREAAQLFSREKKAYVPAFQEGDVVQMFDHCTTIEVKVLRCTSKDRYDVIDKQGFIHVTEHHRSSIHDAPLISLVKPTQKFRQGYDQKVSGAPKKVPYLPSYTTASMR